MKKLFLISFYIIFLISLIIAFFSKISFYLFFKRSIIYFILLFIGMKTLDISIKELSNQKSHLRNSNLSEEQNIHDEDFKPLEFNEIDKDVDGKNIKIKNNPRGLTGNE